jgi:isopentenyl-diphosphate delta-isomerase
MALEDINTETHLLGHRLSAPILISAMTGGMPRAREINRRLAKAAQELGLAMGVGSQRAGIEDPSLMDTYKVRDVAPDILLFANLGAVQLNYGYGLRECLLAIESIQADALVLHLNPLQEALQPEGDTDFRGLIAKIAAICEALPYPVIVKEVGWGISKKCAKALLASGVAALDVAGAGGTSWSEVERHRETAAIGTAVSQAASARHRAVSAQHRAFMGWGIPTADALIQVRKAASARHRAASARHRAASTRHRACPDVPIIASGGITDGVEIATCLALGADAVGMAHALLQAAADSSEAVIAQLAAIIRQLRIAMFSSGARTIDDLDTARLTTRS